MKISSKDLTVSELVSEIYGKENIFKTTSIVKYSKGHLTAKYLIWQLKQQISDGKSELFVLNPFFIGFCYGT